MEYKFVVVLFVVVAVAQCAQIIPVHLAPASAPGATPSSAAGDTFTTFERYQRRSVMEAPSGRSTEVQLSPGSRHARTSSSTGSSQAAKRKQKDGGMMSKILPMMVMPFLVSSSMIPMMLTSLKFMLLKSLFVGKIAIFLLALNALWKSDNRGGVYSHNVNIDAEQKDLHMKHYGYNGDEEYGAYVNRRMGRAADLRR